MIVDPCVFVVDLLERERKVASAFLLTQARRVIIPKRFT